MSFSIRSWSPPAHAIHAHGPKAGKPVSDWLPPVHVFLGIPVAGIFRYLEIGDKVEFCQTSLNGQRVLRTFTKEREHSGSQLVRNIDG